MLKRNGYKYMNGAGEEKTRNGVKLTNIPVVVALHFPTVVRCHGTCHGGAEVLSWINFFHKSKRYSRLK